MYARNLEGILANLCRRGDVSGLSVTQEFQDRFKSLRDYRRLPQGRERREEKLTYKHIAAAVLGLVARHPAWAGHVSLLLEALKPVGGVRASFFAAETLSDAIATLLSTKGARDVFVSLTATGGETGINSNGGAELVYESNGERRSVYFVSPYATSLLVPGREVQFQPDRDRLNAPAMWEISFNRAFFEQLAREYELAERFPAPPTGDGSEYDAENAQSERYRKLGVRSSSRFLNVGVDNQVTWPNKETLIRFDKYHLVLMPKTADKVQSVHVDLTANRLAHEEAMTVVNRFLSVMTWCDDNFAIAQDGWSGNPIPVPVSKRDLAFTTAYNYAFDRKIPKSEEARRALALYREARNAQQNEFISYAVLNYYKIIEIRNNGKEAVREWFRLNFEALRAKSKGNDDISRFLEFCGEVPAHRYIYNSCRLAVAHAGKDSKSDPDDVREIVRLHAAAAVMRLLARRFIEQEFAVSDVMYSGE
jgi:hypothetical protein